MDSKVKAMKKWFFYNVLKCRLKTNSRKGCIVRSYETAGDKASFRTRGILVYLVIVGGFVVVSGWALYHQTFNNDFLRKEGDHRYEARISLPAERGRILDRNGEFLATSVPANSIWTVPEQLLKTSHQNVVLWQRH